MLTIKSDMDNKIRIELLNVKQLLKYPKQSVKFNKNNIKNISMMISNKMYIKSNNSKIKVLKNPYIRIMLVNITIWL